MKIRNGFVSNSSSSSFVVKYRVVEWSNKKDKQRLLLTKNRLKKLKKFGFKYTHLNNPYFIGMKSLPYETNLKAFDPWVGVNLGRDVICNQSEVIYFLLKNKMPFVALCHYDEKLVVWDGKSNFFIEMPNLVEMFSKSIGKENFTTVLQGLDEEDVKQIQIDKWLADEDRIWRKTK